MFTKFEEGVTFALIHFRQPENIRVKRDRFLNVAHLDRHVIAAEDFHAHGTLKIRRRVTFRAHPFHKFSAITGGETRRPSGGNSSDGGKGLEISFTLRARILRHCPMTTSTSPFGNSFSNQALSRCCVSPIWIAAAIAEVGPPDLDP
jgi:hypothetical protein